jgi:hypothetical protein
MIARRAAIQVHNTDEIYATDTNIDHGVGANCGH